MLTIVSAMEEELAPVRAALAASAHDQPGSAAPSLSFSVIGIGRDGVDPNVKGLLRTLRQRPAGESPSGLLLLGFAGGVDPSLSPGELALAGRYCHLRSLGERLVRVPDGVPLEEFRQRMMAEAEASDPNLPRRAVLKFEESERGMRAGWEAKDRALPRRAVLKFLEPDPGLWQHAKDALAQGGLAAVETDSMTVPQVVASPDTKRELHRQYQVGTVNMEDYWVARVAAAAKVPFLSVRAVLDTADQGLPHYVFGLSGKRGWAALNTLIQPWRITTMLPLAGQMRQAQASLTSFALAYISTPPKTEALPPLATT